MDEQLPREPEWLIVSDQFEALIGRMVVTFAHVEGGLRALIAAMTGGPFVKSLALATSLSFRQMLPAAMAQMKLTTKSPETLEHLQQWIAKAETVATRRNLYVHNQLVFDVHENKLRLAAHYQTKTTTRNGLKIRLQPVTLDDINQLNEDLAGLSASLVIIAAALVTEGAISPETSKLIMHRSPK